MSPYSDQKVTEPLVTLEIEFNDATSGELLEEELSVEWFLPEGVFSSPSRSLGLLKELYESPVQDVIDSPPERMS